MSPVRAVCLYSAIALIVGCAVAAFAQAPEQPQPNGNGERRAMNAVRLDDGAGIV
jgi:hypothetical protein